MLEIQNFDFKLPKHLIAQNPRKNKDSTKLLEIRGNIYKDHTMKTIHTLFKPNDLLVINNTKVIKSRIIAIKNSSPFIITLISPLPNSNWLAFSNKTKKLSVGDSLKLHSKHILKIINKSDKGEIEVHFSGQFSLDKYLEIYGFMPLPPYIKRAAINCKEDVENYQSIFAKNKGAVAAPTASLHFSNKILDNIKNLGVKITEITLHVGAGTFLPVKTKNIKDHVMHREYCEISAQTAKLINETKKRGGRVIALGTTVLRTLEHVKNIKGKIMYYKGETDIFIYPGFKFAIVDALITNFHTPKSTLLILVSAFCGIDNIKRAYEYAISKEYQFFSYGDCTFLHKINTL